MAMNGDTLGTAVGNALFAAIPADVLANMSAAQCAEMCNQLINNWKLIAGCIVTHIQTNAVVTTPAGVAVATSGVAVPVSCVMPATGATTAAGIGTIA